MTFPLPVPFVGQSEAQQNFDALAGVFPIDGQSPSLYRPPRTVTSLPPASQAFDGMEVYYVADGTNGVTWHLKYKSSEATYKWHYVGGPPLVAKHAGSQVTASTATNTWAAVSANVLTVTVPLAGDYDVRNVAAMGVAGGASTNYCGVKVGAVEAATTDQLSGRAYGSAATAIVNLMAEDRQTFAVASTALEQRYLHQVGTNQVMTRYFGLLAATPVRVI